MSTGADPPIDLKYRPAFNALPYVSDDLDDVPSDAHQSFSFFLEYRNISFEEQRLRDMGPPPPTVTGNIGHLTTSAHMSLKAAYTRPEAPMDGSANLLRQVNVVLSAASYLTIIRPSLPIATLHVGKGNNPTKFGIHQNILEHCSPFFKALFLSRANNKSEANTTAEDSNLRNCETSIALEADAAAFGLYTEWVYSGRICKGTSTTTAKDVDLAFVGQAYILGEKLLDHNFKNAVVDFLLEMVVATSSLDLTLPTLIFETTSALAPIRRLLVDLYAWYGHKDWLKASVHHNTFLSDLSTALLERHGHDGFANKILTLDPCHYHEHPDGQSCSMGKIHPREIVEPKPKP
ncbi:hypothetical protein E4T48_06676 [Aureobasidium sp. EXF-10727]|nr:hypothetical protein E4T48_06676 [Aureobasidium sp. EXF-10727]